MAPDNINTGFCLNGEGGQIPLRSNLNLGCREDVALHTKKKAPVNRNQAPAIESVFDYCGLLQVDRIQLTPELLLLPQSLASHSPLFAKLLMAL